MRRVGLTAGFLCVAAATAAAQGAAVVGRIAMLEKDNRPSRDLGNTVVWLEGTGPAPAPARLDVFISDKIYVPRVLVVPVGSTVRFPNRDPLNHNVFSVSDSNAFDLGLFGRGETKQVTLRHPGLVRIFCNVHPRMVAYAQVVATVHAALARRRRHVPLRRRGTRSIHAPRVARARRRRRPRRRSSYRPRDSRICG